jgi:hypothetical protein
VKLIINPPYTFLLNAIEQVPAHFLLADHLGGFNKDRRSLLLDKIQEYAVLNSKKFSISHPQVLESDILERYDQLGLNFDFDQTQDIIWEPFQSYNIHPEINYKNFICSFNGSPHVSRKFLVSILQKFGYFNNLYCSKNFSYSIDTLDGQLLDYVSDDTNFYRKFFISHNSEDFFQSINSFGHIQYDHRQNIYNLENKLTESFLHIVSETLATSYYPYVTEKFLYSIVTRGLFLAYAQPGWHDHLEKYYGFKKYNKLFDYRFDSIQNPVERLVELVTMISKFSRLTPAEWHDLRLLEQDTIEYNYKKSS